MTSQKFDVVDEAECFHWDNVIDIIGGGDGGDGGVSDLRWTSLNIRVKENE